MQVVIEISSYDKEWITNGYYIPEEINMRISEAIAHGTPLPKGHGDLIDRSKLETTDVSPEPWYSPMWAYSEWMIDEAEVIIPADKENEYDR